MPQGFYAEGIGKICIGSQVRILHRNATVMSKNSKSDLSLRLSAETLGFRAAQYFVSEVVSGKTRLFFRETEYSNKRKGENTGLYLRSGKAGTAASAKWKNGTVKIIIKV